MGVLLLHQTKIEIWCHILVIPSIFFIEIISWMSNTEEFFFVNLIYIFVKYIKRPVIDCSNQIKIVGPVGRLVLNASSHLSLLSHKSLLIK